MYFFTFAVNKTDFTSVDSFLMAAGSVALMLFFLGLLTWIGKRWVDRIEKSVKALPSKEDLGLVKKMAYLEGKMDAHQAHHEIVVKLFSSVAESSSSQTQELFASTRRHLMLELQSSSEELIDESVRKHVGEAITKQRDSDSTVDPE